MTTKCFSKFCITLLISISIKHLSCFKCGAGKLNIKPGIVNITEEENKRRLAKEFTNIKIKVDYSSFTKPNSMDSDIFNKIKSLIEETVVEIQKFIKVQHVDVNLALNGKEQIKRLCGLKNLMNGYENLLIENDLVIFPSFDYSFETYTIAGAATCLQTMLSKPCAGTLYINSNIISLTKKNTDLYYKNIFLHEITHVLIFNPIFLAYLNMLKIDDENIYVKSPKVLEKARNHFNCQTLEGLPLEDQGGDGTAGFHWEGRYMLGDYMIGADYPDSVISDITLAVLQDSGFYEVDYNYGGLFKFGKNKGCEFFNKKCIENGVVSFEEEFCLYTGTSMCSQSKASKSECVVYDFSLYNITLPEKFQYFENPNYGGAGYADFCPIPEPLIADDKENIDDYYPNSCSVGTSKLPQEYGETIGSHSFCFISSLLPSTSSYNVNSRAICYDIECNRNNKQIILKIGGNKVECPTEGGIIAPSGFKGEVKCPKYTDICIFRDEKICNEIFGCLKKESNSSLIKSNILPIFAFIILYLYML